MPEHTGTATVHPFLLDHAEQLGSSINSCQHSHEPVYPRGTNVTFSFIANPFRRVLSNAGHNGIVSGGRRMRTNLTVAEEVEAFRHFVRTRFCAKNVHMIPHGVWQQASLISRFPRPHVLRMTRS